MKKKDSLEQLLRKRIEQLECDIECGISRPENKRSVVATKTLNERILKAITDKYEKNGH
jgi:hypothetical protein